MGEETRAAAEQLRVKAERTAARGHRSGAISAKLAQEGWVLSHDLMRRPILPAVLREAEQLLAQAFELQPDGWLMWQRALLLMEMGEFDAAIDAFNACVDAGNCIDKNTAAQQIGICRTLQKGDRDPRRSPGETRKAVVLAEMRNMFSGGLGQANPGVMDATFDAITQLFDGADHDADDTGASDDDVSPDPLGAEDSAAICAFAENFVWALFKGDFANAHAALCRDLREELGPADLEREVAEMSTFLEGPVTSVEAQPPENDMPDMGPDDLAFVYVACASEYDNDAVSFMVCREDGQLRLSNIEWGRP